MGLAAPDERMQILADIAASTGAEGAPPVIPECVPFLYEHQLGRTQTSTTPKANDHPNAALFF